MNQPAHRTKSSELAELRSRLAKAEGKQYWRSLEQIAEAPEFLDYVQREFPEQAAELHDPVNRRRFLQLMGASLALGGATACTNQPAERIIPYVRQPEELIPGKPLYFASATTHGGYAVGVLVESHMGRPTKLEGNPEHPASLGASDAFVQAGILDLYDPDRSQVVKRSGAITTWSRFIEVFTAALDAGGGNRMRILSDGSTSPTLAGQMRAFVAKYPGARWHQYEAASRGNAYVGARRVFGEDVEVHYDFAVADVVVTLDADLFGGTPGNIRYTRDLSARRRVRDDHREMARLYSVESCPTTTGTTADHRWRLRSSQVEAFARALADELGVPGLRDAGGAVAAFEALGSDIASAWIREVAADLREHGTAAAVVPGDAQPAAVHALAHAINAHLGSVGTVVQATDPVLPESRDQLQSMRELVADMNAGNVDILVIVGGNPVYDAPADLAFSEAMATVGQRVRMGLYEDETSQYCHWHLPTTHPLEAWGDALAYDGTATLQQPLIEPLYGGRSTIELMAALLQQSEREGYEIVRAHWRGRWEAGQINPALGLTFEQFWRRVVHDGLVAGTAHVPRTLQPIAGWDAAAAGAALQGMEVTFRPDPTIWDGRYANNGWMQETPKPITKLTWDNAALLSPATAEQLGVHNGDLLSVVVGERSITLPAWILPGHCDGALTLPLGYGRTHAGRVGNGTGFDVNPVRTTDGFWLASAEVAAAGGSYRLVSTQMHSSMEGRELIRVGDLAEFRETGELPGGHPHVPGPEESMYEPWDYSQGYQWGMEIDLNVCIGCNGCLSACQAENNIPVVGKDQVANGREMHWIRVDRYFAGGLDSPETLFQPVPCMQCENAPCELVCPVAATVHGPEGLNEMVYNRCVGTRYCANNCPYKVRRFNFLNYTDYSDRPALKMLQNPDVTVRSRGVMEKCTYCVQRINVARITAKNEGREIADGEVVTACQQACPAQAITFGNINDPDSAISKVRSQSLHYGILAELGTRTRTNYLAKLRNPNPAIHDTVGEVSNGH